MVRSATGCFRVHVGFLVGWEFLRSGPRSHGQAAVPGTKRPARGVCPAVRVGAFSLPWVALSALMRSYQGRGAAIYGALGQRTGSKSRRMCFGWHERPRSPEEQMGSGDGEGLAEPAQEWPGQFRIPFTPGPSVPHLLGKQPPLTTCPLAPPAEDTPRSNC